MMSNLWVVDLRISHIWLRALFCDMNKHSKKQISCREILELRKVLHYTHHTIPCTCFPGIASLLMLISDTFTISLGNSIDIYYDITIVITIAIVVISSVLYWNRRRNSLQELYHLLKVISCPPIDQQCLVRAKTILYWLIPLRPSLLVYQLSSSHFWHWSSSMSGFGPQLVLLFLGKKFYPQPPSY